MSRVRQRQAIVVAGERHAGRRRATWGGWVELIWEQEAAGSNPAIPTRSELCGSPWRPPTARATVGQRLLAALKRTSMASRKPSPMKLKPTTTATMQSPAGQICHQYPANV